MRSRLSSPAAVMRTGPTNRVEPQDDGAAVLVDIRRAGPSAQTKRDTGLLVLSNRQTVDARNMDDSIGGRLEPSRQRRRTSAATLANELMPGLHQTCCRGAAPTRHKIGTVGTDALRHIGKSLCDRGIDVCGCALMKRIDMPAITCSNAARRRRAIARARNCSPRYTSAPSSSSDVT